MTGLIDLSYPIHEGMTTYPSPNHPIVEVTQLGRHGIENRETRRIVMGTHTGTHCDAPVHFIKHGLSIDCMPLDVFVGRATVVDMTWIGPRVEVSLNALRDAVGGRAPERLILRYDWSDHWGSISYYSDHPYLSEAAAEWIVAGGTRLLGMDSPTPDNPANNRTAAVDSPNHKILLGGGLVLLEYLCNLRSVSTREIDLFAAPLNIRGGDGAPARVIAREIR